MPIRVTCPSCGRSGRVPDHAAGRTISCPACRYRYALAAPPAAPDGLELLDDEPAPPPSRPRVDVREPARPAPPPADDDPYDAPAATPPWPPRRPPARVNSRLPLPPAALAGIGAAVVLGGIAVVLVAGRGSGPGAVPAAPGSGAAGTVLAVPPADEGPLTARSTAEIVAESDASIALIKGDSSSGTGFLVGPGLLATNAHVIDGEFMSGLKVHFPSADAGHRGPIPADLLYEDPGRDLAFLAVRTDLRPLRVAGSYAFRKGEDITVIGSPGIGDGKVLANAVSRGVMSTEADLDGKRFYQMGIAVNPGNSGGPVFDSAGRVIGVVTLKTSEQEALAFCIPVEDVRAALNAVSRQDGGAVAQARSRHRIVHAVKGLGAAGAVYCSVIDASRRAAAGRLDAEDRDRLEKLSSVLDEIDGSLFAAIPGEVPAIRGDALLSESVRSGVAELADNYARLKSAYQQRRGGLAANELTQMKQTHRRLVTELAEALGLEVPTRMLTAFEDHEEAAAPPTFVAGGGMSSVEQFRQRIWERHGIQPPPIPTPPSFRGHLAPRPPSFGPRGRLGPRFGLHR